ncbi:hypothetical protein OIU76_000057 [Salix suchowensis]|nr:hypothetical protein OIU76_000057 [Salix suchowensis]
MQKPPVGDNPARCFHLAAADRRSFIGLTPLFNSISPKSKKLALVRSPVFEEQIIAEDDDISTDINAWATQGNSSLEGHFRPSAPGLDNLPDYNNDIEEACSGAVHYQLMSSPNK